MFGVDAIFNEGVYTWVLKIVTDGQTDSLTNLIKCVVVCRSYSYAFWSTSLWAPVIITITMYFNYIQYYSDFLNNIKLRLFIYIYI